MMQAKATYAPYMNARSRSFGDSLGRVTRSLLQPVLEHVKELVKTIPFTDRESVFNIADYGACEGTASMNFIRDLLITLKAHLGPEVQFQVIYEDQPMNDFNSLIKNILGSTKHLPSYMNEFDKVFPLVSGMNFRKQCVPSNSLHLIMTVSAVHWLSRRIIFKESVYIYPRSSSEEKQSLYNQASLDWESFLLLRSVELKHGALLLVSTDTEYEVAGSTMITMKSIIFILNDIWVSFRDAGKITDDEFLNTNIPFCACPLMLLKKPFDDPTSQVSRSGLRLLSAEVVNHQDVFYTFWKEKKDMEGIDDSEDFAKKYVEAHRHWGNSQFFHGLSESRTEKERNQIVDELYVKAELEVANMGPEHFQNDLSTNIVIIQKQ